jgi:hypothetical protein
MSAHASQNRRALPIGRFAVRSLLVRAIVAVVGFGLAAPVAAQLFGVVFDPTNFENALLRYAELEKQLAQMVQTYQQIRTQYELLKYQAQRIAVDMNVRYRSAPTPWLSFEAANAYGTTAAWIRSANNGHEAGMAYTLATQPLRDYGPAMGRLSVEETGRVETRYDRVQLTDASITHGLEALGFLRGHQMSVEQTIRNLEDDAYSGDPDFNTQIAVLNKLSATAVTSARLAKDANNVLVSLLEQQLLDATDRREAAVQAINAHIAFETDARPLLAQTTAQTTEALTTFRIP